MFITYTEIEEILAAVLSHGVGESQLWAEPLGPAGSFYLAKNRDGDLLFLIREAGTTDRPDRELMSLRIEFGVYYLAESSRELLDGRFTSIKLKAKYAELREPFCALVSALMAGFPDEPSTQEIRDFVDAFAALFLKKPGLPRDRIKGLWGELQFILSYPNREDAVEAWHESQWGSRDFAFDGKYVEIKTTESPTRIHEFSLSQLSVRNKPLEIGSFLIDEEATGSTVLELFETLQDSLDLRLRKKVSNNYFDVLGHDLEAATELKFAPRGGLENSFRVYAASAVPTPSVHSGDPISGVRFRVDLTTIPHLPVF